MDAESLVTKEVKVKVCLVGEEAVGKTSLIRRFVHDEFDERYRSTIGTRVSKKDLQIKRGRGDRVPLSLSIWDIMGNSGVREMLRRAYFQGTRGVLAVCDVTRPESLTKLHEWIDAVLVTAGEVPVLLLANKMDLRDDARIRDEDLAAAGATFEAPCLRTSAKTGENVPLAFRRLGHMMLG